MKKESLYCRLFLLFIIGILFFVSCNNKSYIKRLQEFEEGVSRPTSESELKEAIQKYERRVNDIMIAEGRIGIWYKILGSRYMDQKLYKKALECFRRALELYPENQNIFYQVGLSASLIAKNTLDFDLKGADKEKQKYYDLAVSAYKRAIEIDPNYSRAIYSLSVLYVFELNRPDEAISLLEKIVNIQKKPIDYMFLLARAYFMTGEHEKSVSVYSKIMETTSSQEKKSEAEQNIKFIRELEKN